MKITILAVGHQKSKALETLQEEYIKRLSAFAKVSVVEVKDEPDRHSERPKEKERIVDAEAERALKKINPKDFVVLLDLHGKQWDSVAFSKALAAWQMHTSHLVFVIAGSLGPGEALVKRADERWQLSKLTFTHLMTRILVLEQIYRGFMIQAGRKYHK
jgi:23S rRNA (pseudouridine1915-N3)-methyltransferase